MTKKKSPKQKTKVIWGVKCPKCSKRMFSFFTHDYKTCGCPNNTMVDGGMSYLRYGGEVIPKLIKWSNKLDGKYPVLGDDSSWPY